LGHDLVKIVILDADPAFGSSSMGGKLLAPVEDADLRALGDLHIYQGTSTKELLTRAEGAEVLLTNKVVLGDNEFAALDSLRLVSVLATGVNVVDLNAARAHGVTVCNVPGYSTDSTAQHCIALLLELTNRVGLHDASVKKGDWARSSAFSYFLSPLTELRGKTIGIVGFGAIGAQVAEIARALGMRVLSHTRSEKEVPGVTFVDKARLLRESDVVSLHCPFTDQTKHYIDSSALRAMKPTALLINGSRGALVDESALFEALTAREISGAATDVLSQEPPRSSSGLTDLENCIVTPHIAWASEAARKRLVKISAENVRLFLLGRAQNIVAEPSCPRP
jgi:glycerate dehydrogenase